MATYRPVAEGVSIAGHTQKHRSLRVIQAHGGGSRCVDAKLCPQIGNALYVQGLAGAYDDRYINEAAVVQASDSDGSSVSWSEKIRSRTLHGKALCASQIRDVSAIRHRVADHRHDYLTGCKLCIEEIAVGVAGYQEWQIVGVGRYRSITGYSRSTKRHFVAINLAARNGGA